MNIIVQQQLKYAPAWQAWKKCNKPVARSRGEACNQREGGRNLQPVTGDRTPQKQIALTFCIFRKLIFAIMFVKDWFFLFGITCCDFREVAFN